MLNSFGKNTAAAVHIPFYNIWIWWRHYCKRTRTQVWPFIAYTHRKGWRSIVASSINVDEFVCFLLILTYKRENMVKHGFWVKLSVGCGENFLVIYIIWSTSFQLAVEVVEGDILKPYQIFHDIHWMRGLFVTWKPNINYILDTLDAFDIWLYDIHIHIIRNTEYSLLHLKWTLEKSGGCVLTVNFEIGTKSGTWSYLSLQSWTWNLH